MAKETDNIHLIVPKSRLLTKDQILAPGYQKIRDWKRWAELGLISYKEGPVVVGSCLGR